MLVIPALQRKGGTTEQVQSQDGLHTTLSKEAAGNGEDSSENLSLHPQYPHES